MAERTLSVVYDLRTDLRRLTAMQMASRGGRGLSAEPALVGSEEWWAIVRAGRLPLHILKGIVGRSGWTGHGDYPEFTLISADGATTSWGRYGDETRYVTGLAVQLSYVEHPWHPGERFSELLGSTSKVVVLVEIETSDDREVGSGQHS